MAFGTDIVRSSQFTNEILFDSYLLKLFHFNKLIVCFADYHGMQNQVQMTIDELKKINNTTSNQLDPGQRIMVPYVVPEDFTIYTVKPNDSAFTIAQNFGITVDALLSANNLSSPTLAAGQKIKIPTK